MVPNIVGDLTRKILSDKRQNSELLQELLVQGGMELENSQNPAITIAFMEIR